MRHGESVHFVRPDRVIRTGVLTPIVGYQPQHDVIAVTQEFALGPSSGMQLQGLFGLGAAPNWFQRLGLRIRAAFAQRRAERMMLTAATPMMAPILTPGAAHGSIPGAPMAPMVANAPMVVPPMPSIPAQHRFAQWLVTRDIPMRAEVYPQRRWNTYYYAG